MNILVNKRVVCISTPTTFCSNYHKWLCPIGLIPIGVLKLISFLKKHNNEIFFINMYSEEGWEKGVEDRPNIMCKWKKKKAGIEGKHEREIYIAGKCTEYLVRKLREIGKVDEVWISSSFTFDYEIVKEYINTIRKIQSGVKIRVGGDFVRAYPEIARTLGADEVFTNRIYEADICEPDFSVKEDWKYGLFQLQLGCINKCSFCTISRDRPISFNPQDTIKYMKIFYDKYEPVTFWNFDPNAIVYPKVLEEFLDLYSELSIPVSIKFGKGFQSNLVNENIVEKLKKAKVDLITIPMECASYKVALRLRKPYTIISSIKALEKAKEKGLVMGSFFCSWVVGYPDDDFSSFFRIFATVIRYKAQPIPFPVFLFPSSSDYHTYYELIKHKDLSELHGELWPLVKDENVERYERFFTFIRFCNFNEARMNLNLLDKDMKIMLLNELEKVDRFIQLCLEAPKDSIEELKKIEKEITMKKIKKTRTLLYIVSNPKSKEKAISKQLGEYFVKRYCEKNPRTRVIEVDLYKEGLTYITEEYLDIVYYKKELRKVGKSTKRLLELVEKYISQLENSDEVVIATPMYTLSIPAILKSYFEMVASRLYYYYGGRLLKQKPVVCIITRDGMYPPDGQPTAVGYNYINAQETMLRAALDFIGLSKNPRFILCEGLIKKERHEKLIEETKKKIDEYINLNT